MARLIDDLLKSSLKLLTEAHDLYMEHYRDEFDADWVSLQYNNACISIENMMNAAAVERAEDGE